MGSAVSGQGGREGGGARERARLRYKLWVERDGQLLFGKGRAQLLRALDEEGSLVKAAKRLNMSYRAAWGKLRTSEEHLGLKLAEPSPEGRHGMSLTPQGRLILDEYERLLREADDFCERQLRRFEALLAAQAAAQKKTPRAGTRGVTTEEA